MDYLSELNKDISRIGFNWDYFKPLYFRKNKFMTYTSELLAPKDRKKFSIREKCLNALFSFI